MKQQHFWMGDPHFGHANIIKYTKRLEFLTDEEILRIDDKDFRPSAEAVQRMNDTMHYNTNCIVGENDFLWILGDFCFSPKDARIDMARKYLSGFRCRNINLVGGNHDDPDIRDLFQEAYGPEHRMTKRGKVRVYSIVETVINQQRIVMSHFPVAVWDNSYGGDWMLYGHCHATAEAWLERTMPHRRSLDVGIDHAKRYLGSYRPFSFDDIMAHMRIRLGHHVYMKAQKVAGDPASN